ncbi:hypothetical protein F2Q70_00036095 [Brassica cretica]|uniref:Uncharacterized protein n=1 Tax=Brassica cretica TaxID=69181 RepID=A0A8S9JWG2_BRACR|nr:hypothetical protein F2Q68_00031296 [Brassica cretica]KAF2586291.1 hypothetical protein F2Q70_00036095 [Brassica cretica]
MKGGKKEENGRRGGDGRGGCDDILGSDGKSHIQHNNSLPTVTPSLPLPSPPLAT